MKVQSQKTRHTTSSTRSNSPVEDSARRETAPTNWLGFESMTQKAVFAIAIFTLLIAPFLFSNFWPATHDPSAQGFWSALAACAALLLALSPRPTMPKISPATLALCAFFAWSVLSSVTTVYWHDTLLELSRVLTGAVWFLVLRELLLCGERADGNRERVLDQRRVALVSAWVIGLVVICVLSAVSFAETRYPRQAGTFFNSNLFANACAMTLPLALSLLLAARRTRNAMTIAVAVFLVVFAAIGLFITSSKGGLLAAIVASVWCALILMRAARERLRGVFQKNRVLVSVIALLLLVVVGVAISQTILPRLLYARVDDNSTLFRAYTWQSTAAMALANPIFGGGAGSFPHLHPQFAIVGATQTAHQLWLQIAAENGVPAALLLLLACALFLRRAWRQSSTRSWIWALGASGVIVAFFVHGMTDAGWSISSIVLVLMLAFALCDTLGNDHAQGAALPTSRDDEPRLRIGWLLAVLGMGAASYFAQRAASGEEARDASRQAARNGSATLVLELAREATELDPLSSRAWSWLGVVQRGNSDIEASETSFARATQLNPQSATAWRSWAGNRGSDETSSTRPPTSELWNRAVENAPRETATRLERARWLLLKNANDATAIADLETIVRQRDEPYGRYPALSDFDNLDFARASLPLAQRAAKSGDNEKVATLTRRALDDITKARPKLARQEELAEAGDNADLRPPTDLDELEAQLRKVQSDISRK